MEAIIMPGHRLGQFYEGFSSWRRALSRAAPENQQVVFANCASEVASWIGKGLDKIAAVDELIDMAASIGFDDADAVQKILSDALTARSERPAIDQYQNDDDDDDPPGALLERLAGDGPSLLDDVVVPLRPKQASKQPTNGRDQSPAHIDLIFPYPIDAAALPKRPWLVPGLLLRRQVTLLIAPPGIGKSLLTLQLAIMCAAPLPTWGGWRPRQRCRVLLINSEEDSDEMQRRLWATAEVMAVDPAALRDQVAYAANPADIVIAKADSRSKTVTRMPMIDTIVATVREQEIDLLVVDPFAETFIGDENSNSELKWAAVLWREVARFTDCAVLLVHHAKKYSKEPGDIDAARGGGSLAGVARIVCTLFAMSEDEAAMMLPEEQLEERGRYLRFDDAKSNQSLVSHTARWFEKQSKQLPSDEQPVDEVGVLAEWKPTTAFDNMSLDQARQILDELDVGVRDDDGAATGDHYLLWSRGQKPKYWAGDVIQRRLACTEKEAKAILKAWRKNRVIETFTATTPQTKRHPVDGNVRVIVGNRPGEVQHDEL